MDGIKSFEFKFPIQDFKFKAEQNFRVETFEVWISNLNQKTDSIIRPLGKQGWYSGLLTVSALQSLPYSLFSTVSVRSLLQSSIGLSLGSNL